MNAKHQQKIMILAKIEVMPILKAVAIVLVIAILLGLLLAVADKFLKVEEDERITVDLSEDHSDKIVSITDILLGNEGEDK